MATFALPLALGALLPGLKAPAMEYRKLGSSDMMVSNCCLGTMT